MNAAAADFVQSTVMETVQGKAAKRSVLRRMHTRGAVRGAYRCTACGGRCEANAEYDDAGNITRSRGKCRTPGCIAWED